MLDTDAQTTKTNSDLNKTYIFINFEDKISMITLVTVSRK